MAPKNRTLLAVGCQGFSGAKFKVTLRVGTRPPAAVTEMSRNRLRWVGSGSPSPARGHHRRPAPHGRGVLTGHPRADVGCGLWQAVLPWSAAPGSSPQLHATHFLGLSRGVWGHPQLMSGVRGGGRGASRGVAGARASPQGAPNSPRETGPELEAKKPDRAPATHPSAPGFPCWTRGEARPSGAVPRLGDSAGSPSVSRAAARLHLRQTPRAGTAGHALRRTGPLAGGRLGTGALAPAGPLASPGLHSFST